MSGKNSASRDRKIRVVYDGWPLALSPGSPAATHLLELLSCLPASIEPWLALPQETPLSPELSDVRTVVDASASSNGSRLRWEQKSLPALARRLSAHLLHLTTPYPPLLTSLPCLYSPVADLNPAPGLSPEPSSLINRLRVALGRGGLSGLRGLLWPEDLPLPQTETPVYHLPPLAHAIFFIDQPLFTPLPDSYVLCPGPLDDESLSLLIAAWSWVSSGLGEEWSLVVTDLSPANAETLQRLFADQEIADTLVSFHSLELKERAAAFQQAAVIVSLSDGMPWGDPLLQALACGRPIVGWETPTADARVGPAGYLVPFGDTRALGSAIVTLLVEEAVAEQLSEKARERARQWDRSQFRFKLSEIYQQAVDKSSTGLYT